MKKYPHGFDKREEPAAPIPADAPKPGVDIEWDDVNFKWIPVSEWVERILPQKFEKALELYRYDATPTLNTAPPECWPSPRALRQVLHLAACNEGAAATRHLDRIPDPDVRLLAQIELCAAWSGLNQIGGAIDSETSRRAGEAVATVVTHGHGRIRRVERAGTSTSSGG